MHVALDIALEANLSRNVAALEGELARLHYLRGEFDASGEHAKRAQALAKEIGDKLTVSIAGAYQAALSTRTGLYNAGRRQLEQHLKKAEEIGDYDLVAHIDILLADVLYNSGIDADKNEGRRRLNQVLTRLQEKQNASLAKQAQNILASHQ
jgi:hypothetical protein